MKLSPKARLPVGAWFIAIILLPAAGRLFAEPWSIEQKDFEVTLVPDKTAIMVGEPVFASVIVKNKTGRDFTLSLFIRDKDARFRDGALKLTAVDKDGSKLPEFNWNPFEMPFYSSSHDFYGASLPANGATTFRVFVPWWVTFEKPGSYTLTVDATLRFVPPYSGAGPDTHLEVKASATLEVEPADKDKMGAVIDDLLKTASHGPPFQMNESNQKLLAIHDARVVPFLWEMVKVGSTEWDRLLWNALDGLDWEVALDDVKAFMKVDVDGNVLSLQDVRRHVADTILQGTNPRMMEYLISLRSDPDLQIRLKAVKALATKVPRKEAIPILQELADSKDAPTAKAAKWYLDEMKAKWGDIEIGEATRYAGVFLGRIDPAHRKDVIDYVNYFGRETGVDSTGISLRGISVLRTLAVLQPDVMRDLIRHFNNEEMQKAFTWLLDHPWG